MPPNYWELLELRKQGIDALDGSKPFGNREFLSIFYNNPNFFAISKQAGIKGDKDFNVVSPPPIPREQIADVGIVSDADGVQRRGLLYPITKEPAIPSLSWALAKRYLEGKGAKIDGIERNNEFHLKVNNTVFWKFRNFSGPYTRADEGGYQILVNWRKSDFKVVTVSDILDNKIAPSQFKDRIVIVGAYAPSLNDQFLTPLNPEWSGSPRRIDGIEAIAQVTSYTLSAVLDDRHILQTWREPWISFAILSCGLIIGYLFQKISIERMNIALLLLFLVSISLFCLFFLLLPIGYWIPISPLVLAILSTGITYYIIRSALKLKSDRQTILTYQERQENMIEKRQHYLFVYNSFVVLGNKIIQPIQSLLLIDET